MMCPLASPEARTLVDLSSNSILSAFVFSEGSFQPGPPPARDLFRARGRLLFPVQGWCGRLKSATQSAPPFSTSKAPPPPPFHEPADPAGKRRCELSSPFWVALK